MSNTHTFATLNVSATCYEEIKARLEAAEYQHTFIKVDGKDAIDMNGIALTRENDDKISVWLLYEGKRIQR